MVVGSLRVRGEFWRSGRPDCLLGLAVKQKKERELASLSMNFLLVRPAIGESDWSLLLVSPSFLRRFAQPLLSRLSWSCRVARSMWEIQRVDLLLGEGLQQYRAYTHVEAYCVSSMLNDDVSFVSNWWLVVTMTLLIDDSENDGTIGCIQDVSSKFIFICHMTIK